MMGVSESEVDEVLQNAKADLRIAGFEEEEKRLRQRISDRPHASLQLPQGRYIFRDFRTLEIPGVELNPPASEALRIMHTLAADPGIVAIMNKHHWCVGIMTEMAPIGYVGISPKCILGFNKNYGEEISLRLRTDDLKGFRKYESIKKTLLHELAHMVHSEHDANFYGLDKQLNQEAASLDWTRSRSHTLSAVQYSETYENSFVGDSSNSAQKLGGNTSDQLASARASSVAAAYRRLANASENSLGGSIVNEEPDPDDSGFNTREEDDSMYSIEEENLDIWSTNEAERKTAYEPDPDDHSGNHNKLEPDPDDSLGGETLESEFYPEFTGSRTIFRQDFNNAGPTQLLPPPETNMMLRTSKLHEEPDPDESQEMEIVDSGTQTSKNIEEPDPDESQKMEILDSRIQTNKNIEEPDPDDMAEKQNGLEYGNIMGLDLDDYPENETIRDQACLNKAYKEPDPDESQPNGVLAEPDPDDNLVHPLGISRMQTYEPDPDDQELQRIQDPVTVVCSRLQKAIEMLRVEVTPMEAAAVLQTLFKIIRNVIEHPNEMKYRRLRKANPIIERNIANYKAAMEILTLIGFNEDVVSDEIGKAEAYIVLKRNDPGLLWLAKSSLEACIAY
ncbi:ubiquitin and wlm domain-containing metalloprotease [Quercus suber]|uniref:Ubiquitin and wlm domain-containing metalloprotease n=2 Tax=Quercus suber TaxID=58331 RepID=A0AAW0J8F6_QUESU